ncbi:MAG: peptidyl-prolyl cis-trans isomerase C [Myxococcota bacterium]|jgi:peptidyl-prolyl cis-trans isomerase C
MSLRLSSLLREPLTHFILIGAALLALDLWRSPPVSSADTTIVVPADVVASLHDSWHQRTGSPPTTEEAQGLIDAYVRDEVLYREAMRMGFAHGDLIVRRRLVQKMGFLLEDIVPPQAPEEQALRDWLADHGEDYAHPGQLAFEHRYFSRDRRGEATARDAEDALAALRAGETVPGDPSMVTVSTLLQTRAQVARHLGGGFADALEEQPDGDWQGPIASSYGLHLVRITERKDARPAQLDEVREAVRADYLDDQQAQQRSDWISELTQRYSVEVSLR